MKYAAFLTGESPEEWIAWARRCEAAGFSSLWHGEVVNSALVPLAAVAPQTERIQLGTGVSLAFAHSPVMLAFAALDMDVASHGRFRLGLGVAHPNRNNNWYGGRDTGRTLAQIREYVGVVRAAMQVAQSGGAVDFQGAFYHVRARSFFARSVRQPRPTVPIYMAAVQRRMAALAAELCDGIVGNPLYSARHLREVVAPAVRDGLARGGRTRADLEVLGQCFTVIDDDLARAYRVGAGGLLFSIWAQIYDPIFREHGFDDVVQKVRAAQREGVANPADLIPPEMVDAFCAVGPVDRVRSSLKEREGLLDTVILAVPSGGGTPPDEQAHYRERILQAFSS